MGQVSGQIPPRTEPNVNCTQYRAGQCLHPGSNPKVGLFGVRYKTCLLVCRHEDERVPFGVCRLQIERRVPLEVEGIFGRPVKTPPMPHVPPPRTEP